MATIESFLPYRLGRGLVWALRRRCPLCGGAVFRTWLRLRDRCDHCRVRLDRHEPDHFFGAWTIGFLAAEFAVFGIGVVIVAGTWPEVPWTSVLIATLVLALPVPLVTMPYSRTLWLAFDLAIRPPHDNDFADAVPARTLVIPPWDRD